jgi:FKBP-type peptidyl-prolyl cis-trans isomerase
MRIENMKKSIVLGTVVLGLVACSQGEAPADKPVALDSDRSKLGYAMGMDVGKSLGRMAADIDAEAFVEAFRTSFAKGEMRMKPEEAAGVTQAYFQEKQQEKQAEMAATGAANKSSGMAFLAENKQKDGITTTPSGLQYELLRASEGARPVATDTVKVHYKGTLIDGTEFDSSYARGEPAIFPLNGVIPAWTEGVQLMSVGSKYRLFAPSELAYGERGAGEKIGPNATLIFEVELLEIVKK